MDDGITLQVEAGAPAAIEHVDLGRVADSEQRALEGDGVADAQRPSLGLVDRHLEDMVSHRSPPVIPEAA